MEKNLSKLTQLNRIEYLLKKDKIEKDYEVSGIDNVFICVILCAILLLLIGFYFNVEIRSSVNLILSIGMIYLILKGMLMILLTYIKQKKLTELDNEFFTIEIKPKEVKNGKEGRS